MGWEDQLKQLDADVAAGRLSAQEYRRRREELPTERGRPPGSDLPADPFPPPFRWSSQGTDGTQVVPAVATQPGAEVTQIVHTCTASPAPAADATQVVRQPPADATQVVRQPAADATQVVRQPASAEADRTQVVQRASWPPAGSPTPLQPNWPPAATQPGGVPPHWTSPPWLSGAPAPGPGWTPTGADFFADSTPRKPVSLLVTGAVVLVLVALVVGAVMLFA